MAIPLYILAFVLAFTLFSGIVSGDYYGQQSPVPSSDEHHLNSEEDGFGGFKVQGLIYCRQDGKLVALQGAQARIRCLAEDDDGIDLGQFSMVSPGSDSNGYFTINLSKDELDGITISRCRVHLETYPPGVCRIPTNVNQGLIGASLMQLRTLKDSSRIYSVPPFVYDTSPY